MKVRDSDLHQLMLLPAFYMVFRFKFTQRWNQSKKPSPMVTNYEVWQQKFQQDLIKFKFTAWMKPSLEIYYLSHFLRSIVYTSPQLFM